MGRRAMVSYGVECESLFTKCVLDKLKVKGSVKDKRCAWEMRTDGRTRVPSAPECCLDSPLTSPCFVPMCLFPAVQCFNTPELIPATFPRKTYPYT